MRKQLLIKEGFFDRQDSSRLIIFFNLNDLCTIQIEKTSQDCHNSGWPKVLVKSPKINTFGLTKNAQNGPKSILLHLELKVMQSNPIG